MIRSFFDKTTEAVFRGRLPKGFPHQSFSVARRKLRLLNAVESLDELRTPPGNHLEALKEDRKGQHSIRINDQWRICFVWTDYGPRRVEIVDYHQPGAVGFEHAREGEGSCRLSKTARPTN